MNIGAYGFSAEDRVEIPDSFFSGTDEAFVILPEGGETASHTKHAFRPHGIIIDSNGSDEDAQTATIRGILVGQSDQIPSTRTLALNIEHPRAYRKIYRVGTTARGIEINA